jgi:hypothetical protein
MQSGMGRRDEEAVPASSASLAHRTSIVPQNMLVFGGRPSRNPPTTGACTLNSTRQVESAIPPNQCLSKETYSHDENDHTGNAKERSL